MGSTPPVPLFTAPSKITGISYYGTQLYYTSGSCMYSYSTGVSTIVAGISSLSAQTADGAYPTTTGLVNTVALCTDMNGNRYIVDKSGSDNTKSVIVKMPTYTPLQAGLTYNLAGTNACDSGVNTCVGTFTNNQPAYSETFGAIKGMCYDSVGNLYVCDAAQHIVARMGATGTMSVYAGTLGQAGSSGDGAIATSAKFSSPSDIKMSRGNILYIADTGNNKIRRVKMVGTTGIIETMNFTGFTILSPKCLAFDANENLYVVGSSGGNTIYRISNFGIATSEYTASPTSPITSITVDRATNTLYFSTPTNVWKLVTGTPVLVLSGLTAANGLAIDSTNNLYVSDSTTNKVFRAPLNPPVSAMNISSMNAYIGNGEQEPSFSITSSVTPNIYGNAGPPTTRALTSPGAIVVNPSQGILVAQPTKVTLLATTSAAELPSCANKISHISIRNISIMETMYLSQIVALNSSGVNVLLRNPTGVNSAYASYTDGTYACKSKDIAYAILPKMTLNIPISPPDDIVIVLLYPSSTNKVNWNGATIRTTPFPVGSSNNPVRIIQGVSESPAIKNFVIDYRTKSATCAPYINFMNKYKLQSSAASPIDTSYREKWVRYVRISPTATTGTPQISGLTRVYVIDGETGEDRILGKVPNISMNVRNSTDTQYGDAYVVNRKNNLEALTKPDSGTSFSNFPTKSGAAYLTPVTISDVWLEYDLMDEYPIERVIIEPASAATKVTFFTSSRAVVDNPTASIIFSTSNPSYNFSLFAGRSLSGYMDGPIAQSGFGGIYAIARNSVGDLYVGDTVNGIEFVRKIAPNLDRPVPLPNGVVARMSGAWNGPGEAVTYITIINGIIVFIMFNKSQFIKTIDEYGNARFYNGVTDINYINGTNVGYESITAIGQSVDSSAVNRDQGITNGYYILQVISPSIGTINNNGTIVPIQYITNLLGMTIYLGVNGGSVVMVDTTGIARSYTGTIQNFSPDVYTTYARAATTTLNLDPNFRRNLRSALGLNTAPLRVSTVIRNVGAQTRHIAIDKWDNVYVTSGLTAASSRVLGLFPNGFVSNNVYTSSTGTQSFDAVSVKSDGTLYIVDKTRHCMYLKAPEIVSTIAGTGTSGNTAGIQATSAMLNGPCGVAYDSAGNLYIADSGNHCIKRVTTAGVIGVFAGSSAGIAGVTDSPALFNNPIGLAIDSTGNIYVADCANNRIRRITPGGVVLTIAGGSAGFSNNSTGTSANFNCPIALALNSTGSILYVADRYNNRIRTVSTVSPFAVGTLAGDGFVSGTYGRTVDGTGTAASFNWPTGLAIDPAGNLYSTDWTNGYIRKITSTGVVTTIAGTGTPGYSDGPGLSATFGAPISVAVDSAYNVYTTEESSIGNRIRKLTPSGSGYIVTTFAGAGPRGFADGATTSALFWGFGILVDQNNNIIVADWLNHRIRKITNVGLIVMAGLSGSAAYTDNATGTAARFNTPTSIALSSNETTLYVSDTANNKIRTIATTSPYAVGTYAGTATFTSPRNISLDSNGNLYVVDQTAIKKIETGPTVSTVQIGSYQHVAVSPDMGTLYLADTTSIQMTVLAASLTPSYTSSWSPSPRLLSPVVTTTTRGIRYIRLANGSAPTNSIGTLTLSGLSTLPTGLTNLAVDRAGNVYAVNTQAVYKINTAGAITGVFNVGSITPSGLALDSAGNVYLTDSGSDLIQKVEVGSLQILLRAKNYTSGTTWRDESGKTGRNASIYNNLAGTVVLKNGSGNGIVLNGSTWGEFPNVGVGNSWSMGVWYKSTIASSLPVNNAIAIITQQHWNNGNDNGKINMYLGYNPTNTAITASFLIPGIWANSPNSITLPINEWVNIQVTWDGTNFITYVNGNMHGTIYKPGFASVDNGNSYHIGRKWDHTSDPMPGGEIGEIRIYNTPLTSSQVKSVYNESAADFGYVSSRFQGFIDGIATNTKFDSPRGTIFDANGNTYVADTGNNAIRMINPYGITRTLVSSGLTTPRGVAINNATNTLYITDTNAVRSATVNTDLYSVYTLAGTGTAGSTNGAIGTATFSAPQLTCIDPTTGDLYVVEYPSINGNKVRKITGITRTLPANTMTGTVQTLPIGMPATNGPYALTVTPTGTLIVANSVNKNLKSYTAASSVLDYTVGRVTTVAGDGTTAQLNGANAVAVDSSGNIFVADTLNHRICMIIPGGSGALRTIAGSGAAAFADGIGTGASFNIPSGIAVDSKGNVYVSDTNNNRIRKLNNNSGTWSVSTFAGTGVTGSVSAATGGAQFADGAGTTTARFNLPIGICIDSNDNIYVADNWNYRIRMITSAGVVSTIAGSATKGTADGIGTAATFNAPTGVAVDSNLNVYVADFNDRIRKITPSSAGWTVTTFAGGSGYSGYSDGAGSVAKFNNAWGVSVDSCNNVYVSDMNNHRIRKITPGGIVTTLAGSGTTVFADGIGVAATFNFPKCMCTDKSNNLYLADTTNNRIRRIILDSANDLTTVRLPLSSSMPLAIGSVTTLPGTYSSPLFITFDPAGNLYVSGHNEHRIYTFALPSAPPAPTVLAGSGSATFADGTGTNASFFRPCGLAIDANNNLFVAEHGNHRIRKIHTVGGTVGMVTNVAGSGALGFADGIGTAAQLNHPVGLVFDSLGNLFFSEHGSHRIRMMAPNGNVTTIAGPATATGASGYVDGVGTTARFIHPTGLAFDSFGNLYIADFTNHLIRMITAATVRTTNGGVVTTFAGSGTAAFADGRGTSASFNNPGGICIDVNNNIYVGEENNRRIRMITPSGVVTTIAGNGTAASVDGIGLNAQFNQPYGLAIDPTGQFLCVGGATSTSTIRRITIGSIIGWGIATYLGNIVSPVVDTNSCTYMVTKAQGNGYYIYKTTPGGFTYQIAGWNSTGTPVYTNASTYANLTCYKKISSIAVTASGDIYVAETDNHCIRVLRPILGAYAIWTYVGNRTVFPSPVNLVSPRNVTIDPDYNLYVIDGGNTCIRKISANGSTSTLLTGLNSFGITYDKTRRLLFVTELVNHCVSSIDPTTGVKTVIAGLSGTLGNTDGTGTAARFKNPAGIAVDTQGNLYVVDQGNNTIRRLTQSGSTWTTTTIVGSAAVTNVNLDGVGTAARLWNPYQIAVATNGDLYVACDSGDYTAASISRCIKKITSGSWVVSTYFTFTGSMTGNTNNDLRASGLTVDSSNNLFVSAVGSNGHYVYRITNRQDGYVITGNTTTLGDGYSGGINLPYGLCLDPYGNIFVADHSNNSIRILVPRYMSHVLAGNGASAFADGAGTAARFNGPNSIALDRSGNLIVADTGNHRIRKVTPAGIVTTIGGTGTATSTGDSGQAMSATFNAPTSVSIDWSGAMYVTENSSKIRVLYPQYDVNLVAGSGSAAANLQILLRAKNYTSGTTWTDDSDKGRNATLGGGIAAKNGSGNGIVLNGSTFWTFPNVAVGNSWSMGVWYKKTGAIPANTGPPIVTQQYIGTSVNLMLGYLNAPNLSMSYYGPPGPTWYTSPNTITLVDNQWTNIQVTWDGTNLATYVNGNILGTTQPGFSMVDAGSSYFIGKRWDDQYVTGEIGEVRIYNTPLTSSQVKYVHDESASDFGPTTATASGVNPDGIGAAASFNTPTQIAWDNANQVVYVADTGNKRVRRVAPSGSVTTVYTSVNALGGITVDPSGLVYALDGGTTIRTIRQNPLTVNQIVALDSNGINVAYKKPIKTFSNPQLAFRAVSGSDVTPYISAGATSAEYLEIDLQQDYEITQVTYVGADAASGTQLLLYDAALRQQDSRIVSGSLQTVDFRYAASGTSMKFAPLLLTDSSKYMPDSTLAGYVRGQYIVFENNTVANKTITPPVIYDIYGKRLGTGLTTADSTALTTYGSKWELDLGQEYCIRDIQNTNNASIAIYNREKAEIWRNYTTNTLITAPFLPQIPITTAASSYPVRFVRISVTPAGMVTTMSLTPSTTFNQSQYLTVDPAGNIYVSEWGGHKINKVTPDGVVSLLAGSGTGGFVNGVGSAAQFSNPCGLAIRGEFLYVADQSNHCIRRIRTSGTGTIGDVTTIAAPNVPVHSILQTNNGEDDQGHPLNQFPAINKIRISFGSDSTKHPTIGMIISGPFVPPETKVVSIESAYLDTHRYTNPHKVTISKDLTNVADYGTVYTYTFREDTGLRVLLRAKTYSGTGSWLDESGNSQHATLAAGTNAKNAAGNGIVLNGSTYWTIPALTMGTSWTANVWYKQTAASPSTAYPSILTHQFVAPHRDINISIAANGSNVFRGQIFKYNPNYWYYSGQNTTLVDGRWTNIQITWNGSSMVTYVNGVQTGTTSLSLVSALGTNTQLLNIGKRHDLAEYVTGEIGEVRIYNRALMSTEVLTAYNESAIDFINNPVGLAFDSTGNLFFSEHADGNRIKMLNISTNVVTTIAGSGTATFADGFGVSASFNYPTGIAFDSAGNLYIADQSNHRIRMITAATVQTTNGGVVSTFAGSGTAAFTDATGASAQFTNPCGVCIDTNNNLYIGDQMNHRVRMITPAGAVTTLAGNGTAASVDGVGPNAQINRAYGVALDPTGQFIYVSQHVLGGSLRKVVIPYTVPPINHVSVIDNRGVDVAVWKIVRKVTGTAVTFDAFNGTYIRPITITTGASDRIEIDLGLAYNVTQIVVYYAGISVPVATNVITYSATGVQNIGVPVTITNTVNAITTYKSNGLRARYLNVYVPSGSANIHNMAVIDSLGRNVYTSTAAGNVYVTNMPSFGQVKTEIDLGREYNILYVVIYNKYTGSVSTILNPTVETTLIGASIEFLDAYRNIMTTRQILGTAGLVYPIGNVVSATYATPTNPDYVSVITGPRWLIPITETVIATYHTAGSGVTVYGIAVNISAAGNTIIYFTTNAGISSWQNGAVTPIATKVGLRGIVLVGNMLYVCMSANHQIGEIPAAGGVLTPISGTDGYNGYASDMPSTNLDGTGLNTFYNNPTGIAKDSDNNLYIADTGNHLIRKLSKNANVWTVITIVGYLQYTRVAAHDKTEASPVCPGNPYKAECNPGGRGPAYGSPTYDWNDWNKWVVYANNNYKQATLYPGANTNVSGTSARFTSPQGIALDSAGNIYVADTGNNLIRKIDTSYTVTDVVSSTNPTNISVDPLNVIYITENGNRLTVFNAGTKQFWDILNNVSTSPTSTTTDGYVSTSIPESAITYPNSTNMWPTINSGSIEPAVPSTEIYDNQRANITSIGPVAFAGGSTYFLEASNKIRKYYSVPYTSGIARKINCMAPLATAQASNTFTAIDTNKYLIPDRPFVGPFTQANTASAVVSNRFIGQITTEVIDVSMPASVTALYFASITATSISIGWVSGGDSATSYSFTLNGAPVVPNLSGLTATFNSVTPDTVLYKIGVYTTYTSTNSSSFPATITSYPNTTAPVVSVLSVTSSSITVQWTGGDFTNYYTYTLDSLSLTPTIDNSRTNKTATFTRNAMNIPLVGNTEYRIVVISNRSTGVNFFSNALMVRTAPVIPILSFRSDNQTLSWSRGDGATSYRILRNEVDMTSLANIDTVAKTVQFTDLLGNYVYTFILTATSASGSSESDPLTITTGPVVPVLIISAITANSVTVSWTGGDGASSYRFFLYLNSGSNTAYPNPFGKIQGINVMSGGGIIDVTAVAFSPTDVSKPPVFLAQDGLKVRAISAGPTPNPRYFVGTVSDFRYDYYDSAYSSDIGSAFVSALITSFSAPYQTIIQTGSSITITNMISYSKYTVGVVAINTNGESLALTDVITGGTFSAQYSAVTAVTPSNISSTSSSEITQSAFKITYLGGDGATSLTITVTSSGAAVSGGYGSLYTYNVFSKQVTLFGLNSATEYTVTIRAINSALMSNISTIVVTTLGLTLTINEPSVTRDSAMIQWNPVSNATSYRYTVTSKPEQTTSSTGPLLIPALTAGTSYTLTVTAFNSAGLQIGTGTRTFLTVPPAPAGLSQLSSTYASNSITVTWSNAPSTTVYPISGYLFTLNSANGTPTISGNSAIFNYLTPGSSYTITMKYSSIGDTTTLATAYTSPIKPTITASSLSNITANSFTVTWGSCDGAASYIVYYASQSIQVYPSGSLTLTTTILSLSPNTTYNLRIMATASNTITNTSDIIPILTRPQAPIGLSASAYTTDPNTSNYGCTLTWTCTGGARSYIINGLKAAITVNGDGLGDTISRVITGQDAGTQYGSVTITAINDTVPSGVTSQSISVLMLPGPITNLTYDFVSISSKDTQCRLTWSGGTGADSSTPYRCQRSGGAWAFTGVTTREYVTPVATAGSVNEYSICAWNTSGNGASTSVVCTLFPKKPVAATSNFTATGFTVSYAGGGETSWKLTVDGVDSDFGNNFGAKDVVYPSSVTGSWDNTSFTVIITTTNSGGSAESDTLTYSVTTGSTSGSQGNRNRTCCEGVCFGLLGCTAGTDTAGVTISCSYTLSYRYVNTKCIKAKVNGSASSGGIGLSDGGSVPAFNLYVNINGQADNRVGTSNPTAYTHTGVITSLTIKIRSYATNNSGGNVSGDYDWSFNANSVGQLLGV